MNCAELRTLRVLHRSSFTRSLHLQEAPDGLSSGSFAPALGFSFLATFCGRCVETFAVSTLSELHHQAKV